MLSFVEPNVTNCPSDGWVGEDISSFEGISVKTQKRRKEKFKKKLNFHTKEMGKEIPLVSHTV
jgi:hypothetical protein